MAQVLYGSRAVRNEIARIFSDKKRRRVAVVGFVGVGASAYLREPDGVELFCWPKAGGTNPDELRELSEQGTTVNFVDKLHAKVFWAEGKGAVIGSANLTSNALGESGLIEVAVALKPSEVSKERLMKLVSGSTLMTPQTLERLDIAHRKFWSKHSFKGPKSKATSKSFASWYESDIRKAWKLGCWMEDAELSKKSRRRAKLEFQSDDVSGFLTGAARNEYRDGEFLLMFKMAERLPRTANWIYADFVQVAGKGNYEAVEVHRRKPSFYPFRIDKKFISALKNTLRDSAVREKTRNLKTSVPPKWFIDRIAQQYGA